MTELRHRPAARIVANGIDITTQLLGAKSPDGKQRSLVSLTITDEPGLKADRMELEIDNRDDLAPPPVGSTVEVFLGYEPHPERMGLYRVDSWTMSGRPNTLTVSASSAELTSAVKETKTRSWHDKSIGDIVGKIAGEHGLGTAVDKELAGRKIEHIDQQTESDMAFLTRLASRNGATFKLADGKAIFAKKGSKTLPSGGAKPETVIKPADVSTWSVTQSERGGHKSVVTYWHDHQKGKREKATAGSGSPAFRDRRLYGSKAEAEAAGKAKLGELNRGKREGNIDGVGNPSLFSEGVVKLEGFHPIADGTYFAKTVTHTFSASGYTTSVSLETEKSEPDEE